jgi:tetratricopeptide (TPR) repeat protein
LQRLIESGNESKKNQAIAYYNRGLAHENKDDFARAIADYNDANRLDPNDADAFFYRGLDKEQIGDKAGAGAGRKADNRAAMNCLQGASAAPTMISSVAIDRRAA